MIGSIVATAIVAWLAAAAAIVGFKLLTGGIETHGLLGENGGDGPTPERVQMLIASLIGVGGYGLMVLRANAAAAEPLTILPDVPTSLIVVFGGSQAIYLAGKLNRTIKRNSGGTS